MNSQAARAFWSGVAVATVVLAALAVIIFGLQEDRDSATRARPAEALPATTTPELAAYMGELQRLAHKVALSVAAENRPLARFYAYEMGEQLLAIQAEVPEYEGQPVALLIDRLLLPQVKELQSQLADAPSPAPWARVGEAMNQVVQGCNGCHVTAQHAGIKITLGTETNPYNQDFRP